MKPKQHEARRPLSFRPEDDARPRGAADDEDPPLVVAALVSSRLACSRKRNEHAAPRPSASVVVPADAALMKKSPPRVLYLPDAEATASRAAVIPAGASWSVSAGYGGRPRSGLRGPLRGNFGRREDGQAVVAVLSPDRRHYATREYDFWQQGRSRTRRRPRGARCRCRRRRSGSSARRCSIRWRFRCAMPIPNGYASGVTAERACERAGKRLCAEEEWVVACRGQKNRKFPYGEAYVRKVAATCFAAPIQPACSTETLRQVTSIRV